MYMHFRTSLMLGSDAGKPDFLLPHIFNRSTRPAVNSGSYRHPAVRQAGAGTSDGETAYAVQEDRVPGLLELHVEHVSTRTRRVCADRKRRERQTIGFARLNKWAVYAYLEPVVVRV